MKTTKRRSTDSGRYHHHPDRRRCQRQLNSIVMMVCFWAIIISTTTALQHRPLRPQLNQVRHQQQKISSTFLLASSSSDDSNKENNWKAGKEKYEFFDPDDTKILQQRLQSLQVQILEEELQRPPNKNMSPIEVVQSIMTGLLYPYDPLPYSGFRLLLNTATKKWRTAILESCGIPTASLHNTKTNSDKYETIISAIGSSIGRPHNQFAILVGEGGEYELDFSHSDPVLDFGDGTCWVECHLLDKQTKELLVITGWDLCQRDEDGAWLVDWIYWQDFRDEFRPGIGREEWLVET